MEKAAVVETAAAAARVVTAEVSRSVRSSYQRCTPSPPGGSPDAPGPNGTGARSRPRPAECETRTPAAPRRCVHSRCPAFCPPAAHTKSSAAAAAAAAASGARTEWCPVRSHTCYFPTRIGDRRCQGSGSSEQCSRSRRWCGCCSGCSPSITAAPLLVFGRRKLCWMATSATHIVGPRPRAGRGEATAAFQALAAAGTRAGRPRTTSGRPVFSTPPPSPVRPPKLELHTSYTVITRARHQSALAAMEAEAANETVGSVDETVDRREGSSMAVQVSFMLTGIGCVVLYVLFKRWSHRRAVARAQQESEEMQRSPRHFTAAEYAPAALASDARRRPRP